MYSEKHWIQMPRSGMRRLACRKSEVCKRTTCPSSMLFSALVRPFAGGSSVKSIYWPARMLSISPFLSPGRPGAITTGLPADSTEDGIGPWIAGVVDGPRPRLAKADALGSIPKLVPAREKAFTSWAQLPVAMHAIYSYC